jgi:hypothetical protein
MARTDGQLERLAHKVREGLEAGALEKLTVVRIREYLQCSQKTAAAVRRAVASSNSPEQAAAVSGA